MGELSEMTARYPGKAELYFALHDEHTQQTLNLVSRTVHLNVCRELREYLDSQEIAYNVN